jgi:4-hydroxybutyrate CoA-transferase
MFVGLKFCGGCNPRHDRSAAAKQIMSSFEGDETISFVNATCGEKYDALLVVCGCACACADVSSYDFAGEPITVFDPKGIAHAIEALRSRAALAAGLPTDAAPFAPASDIADAEQTSALASPVVDLFSRDAQSARSIVELFAKGEQPSSSVVELFAQDFNQASPAVDTPSKDFPADATLSIVDEGGPVAEESMPRANAESKNVPEEIASGVVSAFTSDAEGDWKNYYHERLLPAAEAVGLIPNDSHVVLAHCVGEPKTLVRTMVENRERYRNVTVHHMVRLGALDYATPGYEENFRIEPWFSAGNARAALSEGRGDFAPVFFHEVPILIRKKRVGCDVALVQVSPPDRFGYVSTGVSVDYTTQAIRTAKISIAQVNPRMPRTLGTGVIHVSEIDWFVEAEDELYELQPPVISDTEKAIGEYCAALVEDGSTLQLGIGGIPDAVMLFLKDKKDLGIHSEMIADGTLALFNSGVINNSRKTENRGRMTVTFLMGTRALYDFAHENPAVELREVDYVNHPITVARQHKMVSINSAMQVDMMGQVNAEAIGFNQFSGVGGQVDFVRGAAMSEDGKSIIAMPSVTIKKDGTVISKIVPFVEVGAPVTTSRCDVDYLVTEYGIAELKGRNLRQRAKNLIAIAHPDTRDMLKEDFEKRFKEKI